MGAGQPDYLRLYQIGKLQKSARQFVPMLAESDEAKQEAEKSADKVKGLNKVINALKTILKDNKIEFKDELKKLLAEDNQGE